MPTFVAPIHNRQIIVVAVVSVPGAEEPKEARFRALVDTGAQGTMVSRRVVDQLEVPSIGVGSFIPASGEPQATPEFQLHIAIPVDAVENPDNSTPTIESSYSSGRKVTTLLLPYQPPNYDILLGMDILSQFHITLLRDKIVMSV